MTCTLAGLLVLAEVERTGQDRTSFALVRGGSYCFIDISVTSYALV